MMSWLYDSKKIKALLTEIFTDDEELLRFCYDTPNFERVYRLLNQQTARSKLKIIDQLIDYAYQNSQVETLLTWVQTYSPEVYKRIYLDEDVSLPMPKPNSSLPDKKPVKLMRTRDKETGFSAPLQIFLCHASKDKAIVRDLYHHLRAEGLVPWLDEEDLIAGQEWQREIPKAVRRSDVVLVCLSNNAIRKDGYLRDEIAHALDIAEQQPKGTIFIIPLRLEECEVPERLRRWHWVNLFEETGYGRLIRALQTRDRSLKQQKSIGSKLLQEVRDQAWRIVGISITIFVVYLGVSISPAGGFLIQYFRSTTPATLVTLTSMTNVPAPLLTSTSAPVSATTPTSTDILTLATNTTAATSTQVPTPTHTPSPTATLTFTHTATPRPTTATQTPTFTVTPKVLISTPTNIQSTEAFTIAGVITEGGYVRVTGTDGAGVSLKAGPDRDTARLLVAAEDVKTILLVISGPWEDQKGEGYTWWLVRDLSGVEGWVVEDFITPTAPPTQPFPTATPIVLIGLAEIQSWVYSQPDETAERTGFVLQNQQIQVIENYTTPYGVEWFRIAWAQGEGWIESARINVIGTR